MSRLCMLLGFVLLIAGSFIPFVFGTTGLRDELRTDMLASFCAEGESLQMQSEQSVDQGISFSTRIPSGSYRCSTKEGSVRDVTTAVEASFYGQLLHQLGLSTGLILCAALVSIPGALLLLGGVLLKHFSSQSNSVVYKSARGSGMSQSGQVRSDQVRPATKRAQKSRGLSRLFSITKLFGLNINEESIQRLKELQQLQEKGEITQEEAKAKLNEILFKK